MSKNEDWSMREYAVPWVTRNRRGAGLLVKFIEDDRCRKVECALADNTDFHGPTRTDTSVEPSTFKGL